MNITTARQIDVAPGASAATRNPVAMWLLVFLTLGIGGIVWMYVANRELRDYSRGVDRPFRNSPVLAAILSALWPVGFFLALIPVFTTTIRTRTAQQWTGKDTGRVNPVLAILLFFVFFAHVWYLQRGLNGVWLAAERGAKPGKDFAAASGTDQELSRDTRRDAVDESYRHR
jgi:amino acid transporter